MTPEKIGVFIPLLGGVILVSGCVGAYISLYRGVRKEKKIWIAILAIPGFLYVALLGVWMFSIGMEKFHQQW